MQHFPITQPFKVRGPSLALNVARLPSRITSGFSVKKAARSPSSVTGQMCSSTEDIMIGLVHIRELNH